MPSWWPGRRGGGNPFTIEAALESGYATTKESARNLVVDVFRSCMIGGPKSYWWSADSAQKITWMRDNLGDLVGKDLACWCALDTVCHGDVLLRLASELGAKS